MSFNKDKKESAFFIKHHESETFEEAQIIHKFVGLMADLFELVKRGDEDELISHEEKIWEYRMDNNIKLLTKGKTTYKYEFESFYIIIKKKDELVKVLRKDNSNKHYF